MVKRLDNRIGKLEDMPEQPENAVHIHLRDGGVFRFEGDFLKFYMEASRAIHDFYHGAGRPLPEFGYDPNSAPDKPELVKAVEDCVGYDADNRVVGLVLAVVPWSYAWQKDWERQGLETYSKKYGWPVLPTKPQEVIH
jgi:hypothetical protein